jgi:hypothetical protein
MVTTPQDHKAKAEPYIWTAPDGRTITLSPFNSLPAGVFRKARSLSEMEMTFVVLEAATDEAGLEVLDEQPLESLEDIFTGWAAAGGVTLPES